MARRNSLDIAREILQVLKRHGELPIRRIVHEINSYWRSTEQALRFLKDVGLVVERRVDHPGSSARLFSLRRG